MTPLFTIPPEQQDAFRRLYPYMDGALKKNAQVMEALSYFIKLGGEKLARVAVDAYNENQRLNDAETKKRLREEALLLEQSDDDEEEIEGETEKAADAEDEEPDFD
jgi:hypothetical protein